jgi:hypothetical protein
VSAAARLRGNELARRQPCIPNSAAQRQLTAHIIEHRQKNGPFKKIEDFHEAHE